MRSQLQSCRSQNRKAAAGVDRDADEELARYAKALGHPARVKILRILARQTECVCGEVVAELPLAQSTVSQHLKILRQSGLIQDEIDGPRVRYCVVPGALARLRELVKGL
ncbi:MAG: ArsR/SmtB family transcription factor [Thermoguttaceae bacterium]|jgi:ArsR family transcriptional regulator